MNTIDSINMGKFRTMQCKLQKGDVKPKEYKSKIGMFLLIFKII